MVSGFLVGEWLMVQSNDLFGLPGNLYEYSQLNQIWDFAAPSY